MIAAMITIIVMNKYKTEYINNNIKNNKVTT